MKPVGAVTSRVIVISVRVCEFRSVTVTRFAPGDTVFPVVHVYVFEAYGLVVSVTSVCVKPGLGDGVEGDRCDPESRRPERS